MRMEKIVENRTLKGAAAEFLAFKQAQKIRERTLHDYEKYINPCSLRACNSIDSLKPGKDTSKLVPVRISARK